MATFIVFFYILFIKLLYTSFSRLTSWIWEPYNPDNSKEKIWEPCTKMFFFKNASLLLEQTHQLDLVTAYFV